MTTLKQHKNIAKLETNQIPWQKLAEAVGVSRQTINFIETGRYWGFLLLRNAPIELDLIFLSKAVDVESQCITSPLCLIFACLVLNAEKLPPSNFSIPKNYFPTQEF